MKPIVDSPEVIHSTDPILHIDMSEMDKESIAFMLKQSRDDFYSNKELAPIREYSTNARDAHIQAGIPERPIEVTLPSQLSPELRIRDFGKGLTIENLNDIYFKYWKSTKRGTNEQNGCLGIGAKSAFAYTAAYTVTTWCNGMKTVATGQKNGFADVIFHQPNVNGEPDGVEIVIPIQQKDIAKFVHESLELFKYWDIRPIFHNVEDSVLKEAFTIMDTKPFLSGKGWAVRPAGYGKSESKAIMGFVPYTIDWEQVKNSLAPEISAKISGIFTFLEENLTALYFDNGTLSFTPNRESLQYNEVTVAALSQNLVSIYESLLNLITNKISDAPNIWEAKIRYNQIFRRELDGFDKDSMYGGNLSTLENLLRNRIQWNGVVISNGLFEDVDDWDVKQGKVDRWNTDNFIPLFATYVKDIDRTGIKACGSGSRRRRWSSGSNTKIIASPKSVVIIQDTDKASLAKGLARWFLYKASKDVSQVYIVDLSDPTTKDAFFKHYHFETVPVSYVSQNELLVKAYMKSIRAPRGSGDATERESRPLYCPFVEIKNRRTISYTSNPSWGYETVNARGVNGQNNYYVVYSKKSFTFNNREIDHNDSQYFWQAIYDLMMLSGVNINKVFGIHKKSAESEWFKEAVEEGNWINLSEFVSENIDCLPKAAIKKIYAYLNVETENKIGIVAASILHPTLVNKNELAGKYLKEVADFTKHWSVKDIPARLYVFDGWQHEESEVKYFQKIIGDVKKRYPLLFKTNCSSAIVSCDENSCHKLDNELAKELTDYINLVDCNS
jgi:hypothetical protein